MMYSSAGRFVQPAHLQKRDKSSNREIEENFVHEKFKNRSKVPFPAEKFSHLEILKISNFG